MSLYLSIRTAYRTLRSTVSLISFMIRWGMLIYIVVWFWLWFTQDHTNQSAMHDGISATHELVQSTCFHSLLFTHTHPDTCMSIGALLWQLSQRPDTWQPILRSVTDILKSSKTKKRRSSTKKRTRQAKDDVANFVDALGLDDWLTSLTAPTSRSKKWNPLPTEWKQEWFS